MPIEPKTLQRRLAVLVSEAKINAEGTTGGTRYAVVQKVESVDDTSSVTQTDKEFSLSKKAQKLLAAMRLPVNQGKAVGYNLSFLNNYEPNVSFYLSSTERKSLAQTGKTIANEGRPARMPGKF